MSGEPGSHDSSSSGSKQSRQWLPPSGVSSMYLKIPSAGHVTAAVLLPDESFS